MSITSDPNAVHELVHAYQAGREKSLQLSNSGAAFPDRNLYAQQITNAVAESEAYMAQYGLDPASMPPSIMGSTPQTMNALGHLM
ncbi:hypothetical protein [Gynurincola endophyticus]|uniref:hypothetical protein n=1 Tax=Gynurincola endophyticus TaxID=2479004 RepID=UPI000F8D97D9|nr:hypothetical protein [Gynurincola endophyticus]